MRPDDQYFLEVDIQNAYVEWMHASTEKEREEYAALLRTLAQKLREMVFKYGGRTPAWLYMIEERFHERGEDK